MSKAIWIDIGNTTIAWCVEGYKRECCSIQRCLHYQGDFLKFIDANCFKNAYICSVACEAVLDFYVSLLKAENLTVHVCSTPIACGGLKNGYEAFDALGTDRWMGMLGAHTIHNRSSGFYVLDCGSANTIDYVDRSGQHQGGVILPNRTAYLKGVTDGVSFKWNDRCLVSPDWGTSTQTGVLAPYAYLIKCYLRFFGVHIVYLTGGGVDDNIKKILTDQPYIWIENLVFQGMRHAKVVWQNY